MIDIDDGPLSKFSILLIGVVHIGAKALLAVGGHNQPFHF
jgi:hypothetical protein